MKKILIFALLFIWTSAQAQVRPEHTGMWYNPNQDGHGLILEYLSDTRMMGFWYLYDLDGNPSWLLLDGQILKTPLSIVEFQAYEFIGSPPTDWNPYAHERSKAGEVVVEFHDCNNASVTMKVGPMDDIGGGYVWWDPIPMERLTYIQGLECGMSSLYGDWHITWQPSNQLVYIYNDVTVFSDGSFRWAIPMMNTYLNGKVTEDPDTGALTMVTELDPNAPDTEPRAWVGEHVDNKVICFDVVTSKYNGCVVFNQMIEFTEVKDGSVMTLFRGPAASSVEWAGTLEHLTIEPWTMHWTSTSHMQPDIPIASDGTFRYGGGSMLCEYEARITIDRNDIFKVELVHTWSTNDGFCLAMYDDPAPGKVYQNYEVCIPSLVGELCAIHDEALVFDTFAINSDGERVPGDEKVILFRDF